MSRRALVLVLPLLSCGDSVATTSDASTGGATTTGTSTGTPTTGGDPTTGTSSTGTTTTGESEGAGSSSTSTGSTTTDTTQGIDPDTSSSSGGGSTSTGEADSSSSSGSTSSSTGEADTSTGSSTDTGDTTTGGETGEDAPVPAGVCIASDLTSFVSPMPGPEELHIFAVYQPTGGAITVSVTRTDVPLTLVLSSYEPVSYTLVLAPGVLLEQVVLDGYNSHSVQGQGAATVIDKSGNFDYLAACSYVWPEDNGGCDTPGLVAGAESLTGLTLTSYAGCYEGSAFSLD